MKSLYTEKEFINCSANDLLPIECYYCHNKFFVIKKEIVRSTKGHVRHPPKNYCSRRCAALYKNRSILCTCSNCGKPMKRIKSQFNSKNYCSRSCSATYNNTHKTKGTRISKLEKWLQQELPKLYPNLEFHFNRKDTINSELDIYIPSLKLAFELNGIFHYEPIYGPEKLKQIQNNDSRKFQACIENQIELCIIDTSSITYFKLEKVNNVLIIIKNIINTRLVSD